MPARPARIDLRPLPEEVPVRIPEGIPGLWKPPAPGRAVGLVLHGLYGRSFHELTRGVAETLGGLGYGTLRILFRPLDWARNPSSREVSIRLRAAGAAARWVRRRRPDAALLLAGWSMGAVVAARLAGSVPASGLVLLSPALRNRTLGVTYSYWPELLGEFRRPKLVIVGGRDEEWAPLDLVRAAVGSWPGPLETKVLRGEGHRLATGEKAVRAAIAGWANRHRNRLDSRE